MLLLILSFLSKCVEFLVASGVAKPANCNSEDVQVMRECVIAQGVAQPANCPSEDVRVT